METSDFKITLLGGFSISYKGKVYVCDTGSSKKVFNLLQYLIVNRKSMVTYESLIYAMKLDEGNKNPMAVLKNLIYRVRTLLKESGLPEEKYILQTGGMYRWNNNIDCFIDTEVFEEYVKKSEDQSRTIEEQGEYITKAIGIYGGKFLPKSSIELWIVPLSTYYDRLFEKSVMRYYDILSHTHDYASMIDICRKAISIDQFNENYYSILIECYCSLGRFKEALEAYEKITDFLYNQFGVKPSDKLMGLYKDIMNELNQVEKNLMVIDGELREEVNGQKSAFYCNYGMFKTMVQFTMRMFERTGQTLCMLLFTVTGSDGEMPEGKKRNSTMENLKCVINTSLRRGDLFARYSATQYIVMLISANYENGGKVGQRIMDKYNSQFFSRTTKITYKVKVMDINNMSGI